MKAEKRQAQKDAAKKVKMNASHLPTVCMYTLLNANGGYVQNYCRDFMFSKSVVLNLFPKITILMFHEFSQKRFYSRVSACELSEDCGVVAVGYGSSNIQVWTATNVPLKRLKPVEQLNSLDQDAGREKKLEIPLREFHGILVSDDVDQQMYDEFGSSISKNLIGHRGAVYATTFSPDRRLILSCSQDSTSVF